MKVAVHQQGDFLRNDEFLLPGKCISSRAFPTFSKVQKMLLHRWRAAGAEPTEPRAEGAGAAAPRRSAGAGRGGRGVQALHRHTEQAAVSTPRPPPPLAHPRGQG